MAHLAEEWTGLAKALGYATEKEMLIELYKEFNLRQMSKILGHSTFTIRQRLMDMGVTLRLRGGPQRAGKRKLSIVPDDILFNMLPDTVAAKYGVHPVTVYQERRIRKAQWKNLSESGKPS